ncbi:MAG TPA: VOC family protein [Steroidobacteraceae bacterium]|nr:VOC family protein [Steroidobacteraceae bacterium]
MRSDYALPGWRRPLAVWLAAAALLTALPAALAAPAFELPAIGTGANAEHHPGKIIWLDLTTPDLAGAERFYGALFDWTFRSIRAGRSDYAVALLDGRPVGGLLQRPIPPGEKRQSAWLTFIAVRNLEAASHAALAHGAKSLAPPRTYAGRGSQEVFSDPQGAVFAALASSSGDSGDYLAMPGEWIWSALLTGDPTQSADFYKAVFGYELYDLPSDDGAQHVILASDGYARAGIHSLPPGHRHPHWINFIRVADAKQAAARAVTLGGRILVEPHLDRHGGQVAVIADPYGAPVGLMEWTAADDAARADPGGTP